MSKDQMTDVFPIIFDYKEGEAPTAEKLTGANKIINTAFDEITRAVGDPWDTQSHTWGVGSDRKKLSLEYLSQASLSRMIGPSDWISPNGGDFNSPSISGINFVRLASGQNSWNLGYPLVKVGTTVNEDSTVSSLTPLTWGTEILVGVDPNSVFNNRVTNLSDIAEAGDFHVDFYSGVITAYNTSVLDITLNFINLHMLPPGVPWGTHNVIPPWNQTTGLCSLTLTSDNGTTAVYNLALSLTGATSRVSTLGRNIAGGNYSNLSYDSIWGYHVPNPLAQLRLPSSIVNSGMQSGDTIPEGFMLLWDEVAGRTRELITFKYQDESNLIIEAPSGLLTVGSNYRLITIGSSLAENVSYLMCQQRFGSHDGLSDTARLGFSIPISHKNLTDRFTGSISSVFGMDESVFRFSESIYPTNDHPQYLHRSGYLDGDSGNSENAMRGVLGFTEMSDNGSSSQDGLRYASGSINSGNRTKTYGIYWGGPGQSTVSGNTRLVFEGGQDIDSWSVGAAHRAGFGLVDHGANPVSDYSSERYGALSYHPWYGTPLFLRGQSNGATNSENYQGAYLGFDLQKRNELNYLKLLTGVRSGAFDKPHLPAHLTQNWSTSTAINPCMPTLSHPVSPEQIRELRFRGGAYISNTNNPEESLGGTSTRTDGGIAEFQRYYTSPGVIGADFLNVYSNAIFFSETGDGTVTGLTTATNWFELPFEHNAMNQYYSNGYFNSRQPTGIYYHPNSASIPYSDAFLFSIRDSQFSLYTQPLRFGDRAGFHYASNRGGDIRFSTRPEGVTGGGIVFASGSTSKTTIDAQFAAGTPSYSGQIYFASDSTFSVSSLSNVSITGGTSIYVTATGILRLSSTSSSLQLLGPSSSNYILGSSGDHTSYGASASFIYTSTYSLSVSDQIDIRTTTAGRAITLWNTTSGTGDNGKLYNPGTGHIALQSTTGFEVACQSNTSTIRFYTGWSLPSDERGTFSLSADLYSTYVRDGSSESKIILSPTATSRIDTGGSLTLASVGQISIQPGDNLRFSGLPTGAGSVPGGLTSGEIWVDTSNNNVLKIVS